MDKNQREKKGLTELQKQRPDLCTKKKKELYREGERERKQKSEILGKHKKSVGFYAATRSSFQREGAKARDKRSSSPGAEGTFHAEYGHVACSHDVMARFFSFFFFFPFPQICEVALSGSVIIFFNFLMLRHWLNPQWNLALNGDRYFLDSKTLVKKKASKVKLESKYEEKKFIKRISILLKKGIL
jgi:hypothetical protein